MGKADQTTSADGRRANAFAALKSILRQRGKVLQVLVDQPDSFSLATGKLDARKRPVHFASVRSGKSYVSYHLMPLYCLPELAQEIPPELKKRMQGKSCFNFTAKDETLFAQLDRLTATALVALREAGLA
jgi:hypothetical protein